MIRVLIVDDSPFIRRILKDILQKDDAITVVGQAKNGKEALEKIPLLKPDLITLDVNMPVMDGMYTLKRIINNYNIPVIMMSSFTTEGASLTLKALEEGAIDFIPKPKNIFSLDGDKIKQDIIQKIKIAAKSKLDANYSGGYISKPFKENNATIQINSDKFEYIIVIGTSTGGPRALQEVLPLFPKNINGTIVVVQHMPPKFTKSLAERLNSLSNVVVKEGEHGIKLKKGHCYIAPGDFHMKIIEENEDYAIELNKDHLVKGLRPSVDVLMESVAKINKLKKVGVIMTGMGNDGSNGIVQMKKANGYLISQDEKSSIVFGMPKAAIATNCIDKIVPLNNIADEIMKKVGV